MDSKSGTAKATQQNRHSKPAQQTGTANRHSKPAQQNRHNKTGTTKCCAEVVAEVIHENGIHGKGPGLAHGGPKRVLSGGSSIVPMTQTAISAPAVRARFARMGFEQLRVYQAAQQLDAEVQKLIRDVKRGKRRGNSKDLDHLDRSVGSVLFNIPEAYGSESIGKKRNHLEIARGEADETRGVLRRLVAKGLLTEKQIRRACELTSVIAKMLTSWIDTLDKPR